MVKITDPHVLKTSGKEYHPILTFTGDNNDQVEGAVFEITHEELLQADACEVADYKRVKALSFDIFSKSKIDISPTSWRSRLF